MTTLVEMIQARDGENAPHPRRRRHRPETAEPRPNRRPFSGVRVLVVEDNPVNQKVAVKMLQTLGCVPDVAGDGREALGAVAAGTYAVVFMDCQMPEMDGFEATAEIRKREVERPTERSSSP